MGRHRRGRIPPLRRRNDDPANGELQEVVPGKFVALKGPVATPDGRESLEVAEGQRKDNGRTTDAQRFHFNVSQFDEGESI